MSGLRALEWVVPVDGRPFLRLLDQRTLPSQIEYVACRTCAEVADAIRNMVVRGAPAIGAAAAFGLVLGAMEAAEEAGAGASFAGRVGAPQRTQGGQAGVPGSVPGAFRTAFEARCRTMAATRPTAVNLFWAIERMRSRFEALLPQGPQAVVEGLEAEARAIADDDVAVNRRIGRIGAAVIRDGDGILTHCNTGSLATVGYGTALGVIRAAHEEGKRIHVYAGETRPFLQGARLTAWELLQDGIPVTLITDNMAGYAMKRGLIQVAVVGADRIAANGDVVNKIGTYAAAVLAKAHRIPFYVAAPLSSIDLKVAKGADVPIEERPASEVTHIWGVAVAPEGVDVLNPAFDVTPAELVTGIITERGIARPPYHLSLPALFG